MNKKATRALLAALPAIAAAPSALAHFKLLAPAGWIVEDMRGDPQKIAPCGGTNADPGTPTGAVTAVAGGGKLTIAIDETIFHPGHYRFALARTMEALPADPEVTMQDTERGPRSLSAKIETNPEPPILLDGLWPHTERPAAPYGLYLDVPNVACNGCVLQIIQFMANHPGVREGGFSYHHCAILDITANPALPVDERWSAFLGPNPEN
jgi:hypothetical protein